MKRFTEDHAMSPAHILIVDDQEANRRLLADLATVLGHQPHLADNGATALEAARGQTPDLILLDIMMPEMDGYETLERFQADPELQHIPVLMVSGVDEVESVVRCIEGGADDYLIKPFNPTLLKARINACLDKKRFQDQQREHKRQIEEYNARLKERVRDQVAEISSTQLATIFAMSKLAESRDPETGEHLERMREYARVIALNLRDTGLYEDVIDHDFVENIYAAAPLHDIGKVAIPDRILQKPGRLTPEEFDIMREHAAYGARTLEAVDEQHPGNAFIFMGINVAESHHEKWDGSGYPKGLSEEDIPLAGRIMALADVYDALTSKRCYKEAMSHVQSRGIILEGKGSHFDPAIVEAFLDCEETFLDIRQRFQDSEKVLLA